MTSTFALLYTLDPSRVFSAIVFVIFRAATSPITNLMFLNNYIIKLNYKFALKLEHSCLTNTSTLKNIQSMGHFPSQFYQVVRLLLNLRYCPALELNSNTIILK